MRYYIIKIIALLCLLCASQSIIAQTLYYEDKDLKKLLHDFSLAPQPLDPHTGKLITISISFIISQDPKTYNEILASFNTIPEYLKPSIVQGIINIRGKDIEVNKPYNLNPIPIIDEINNLSFVFPTNNKKNSYINTDNADYLWCAFYVTGNKDYLKRIIAFLSKFPLRIRQIETELTNRQMIDKVRGSMLNTTEVSETQDLLKSLTPEELEEVVTYRIVSWSLKSNIDLYPAIDSIVEDIFKNQPELNFYKYTE